MVQETHQ